MVIRHLSPYRTKAGVKDFRAETRRNAKVRDDDGITVAVAGGALAFVEAEFGLAALRILAVTLEGQASR